MNVLLVASNRRSKREKRVALSYGQAEEMQNETEDRRQGKKMNLPGVGKVDIKPASNFWPPPSPAQEEDMGKPLRFRKLADQ